MEGKLHNLLKNAYCPYSHFAVSAIVVMNDGTEFSGVNVENASFGGTICAERNAINAAITAGYSKGDFRSLSIMVSSNEISTCCSICRQSIIEFFDESTLITCYSVNGDKKVYTVKELCPLPFGEGDLN